MTEEAITGEPFRVPVPVAAAVLGASESEVVELCESGRLKGMNLRDEDEDPCWAVSAASAVALAREQREQRELQRREYSDREMAGRIGDIAMSMILERFGYPADFDEEEHSLQEGLRIMREAGF